MRKIALLTAGAATLMAAMPASGQYAQPTGGPLSTIFSCQNAGNRQGSGALVGALVGGLAGNQIADNDRRSGTVIGALVGAAAGSMIGCRMQNQDAMRAQQVAQQALASGQSQRWSNPQTGASGRIDVVNTYNYGAQPSGGYGQPQNYNSRPSLNSVRWVSGVEQPREREYQPSEGVYASSGNAVIRSGPSQRARQLGALRNGDQFDGLVRIEGTDWVLASRNNEVLGYVQESQARFLGDTYGQSDNNNYNNVGGYPPYDPRRGQMCRVVDQTYTSSQGQSETQRFTACQTASGEWVVV